MFLRFFVTPVASTHTSGAATAVSLKPLSALADDVALDDFWSPRLKHTFPTMATFS